MEKLKNGTVFLFAGFLLLAIASEYYRYRINKKQWECINQGASKTGQVDEVAE